MNLDGIKGVIFDLDGTLVESKINFTAIREQIGCSKNEDILEFIEKLPEREKAHANAVILQHEIADAENAKWLDVGKQMVQQAQANKLPMAIVTRNCIQATNIKIRNNQIPIDVVLTREDAPPKPDPTALLQIAKQWQLQPKDCLYVGDYIYDQLAAENAGMQWLLV